MIFFLFGDKKESKRKGLTFTMKPNEIEDLANFGNALHGKFDIFVEKDGLNKKDKRVKDVSDGFVVLCRKLNNLAKKSV